MTLSCWIGYLISILILIMSIINFSKFEERMNSNYTELNKLENMYDSMVLLQKEPQLKLDSIDMILKSKKDAVRKIYITKPVHYTDPQIDSILSVWYPR